MSNRVLRLPDVNDRVGLSRSSIYSMIASGKFPRPVALGARSVGWREVDIDTWLTALGAKPVTD
jgi:prophage regulatory protein